MTARALDPADPRTLLRRVAALERRVSAMGVILAGGAYASDEGGGDRTLGTTGSFLDFTGQPVVTVVVPASGRVRVSWGFNGYNGATTISTVRLDVALSGANTITANTTANAVVAGDNNGSAQAAIRSATRTKEFTGLNPGSTTFTVKARVSSGTTHAIQDAWLLVEPQP